MNSLVLVFFGLFIGMIIVGVGVFLAYMVSAVRALTAATNQLCGLIEPIAKDPAFRTLGPAVRILSTGFQSMVTGMEALNKTLLIFTKFAFGENEAGATGTAKVYPEKPGKPADKVANPDESGFISYDDAERAAMEVADIARKAGIETDPERVQAPDPERIKGVNAD